MKRTIIVFLLLLFTVSGMTARNGPLQLTLVPKKEELKLRESKFFEFCIKNVSNQAVTVIVPYETELYWGGYKTLWFVSFDGKVAPPVTNPLKPGANSPKNKGLVLLNPGDSIMVNRGYIDTPKLGVYKVWGVFVQNPETLIEEYRKKLGNKAKDLQSFELHSDTLTYSYMPFCNPLEKEPDYKDLTVVRRLNSSVISYDYPTYSFRGFLFNKSLIIDFTHFVQMEVTPKDDIEEITTNLHYLKNVRGLKLTLESGQAIPDFLKELTDLVSLTITINHNQLKKVPLEGLNELSSLSKLQYIELKNTYIEQCPEWIKTSQSLRALTFLNAFKENPQLSGLPNLEMSNIDLSNNMQGVGDITN